MKRKIMVWTVLLSSALSINLIAQDMIRITSPKDRDDVSHRPVVSVDIQDKTAQVEIEIIVHPLDTDSYWVQPKPRRIGDGKWISTIYIGRPGTVDAGKSFEIAAVANPKSDLREGDQLKFWPQSQWRSNIVMVRRANE